MKTTNMLVCMWIRCAVIGSGAHVTVVALVDMVSLQSKQIRRCTPLNHAVAMLNISGQSDPDPQR